MKSSSNRVIVAMLVVAALAAAFWILVLSPKRQEAGDLSGEVDQLRTSLTLAQAQAAEAAAARKEFPDDYRKLVVIGKAVPGDDETSSLLVELNRIADRAGVTFDSIQLGSGGGEVAASASSAPQVGPTNRVTRTTPPTEAAAALMPLGSTIGPAGLAVMPYDLTFTGSFFDVADFIHGIDSLVSTGKKGTAVDGRLITLDGFVLNEAGDAGFPLLDARFTVTTYLAPPNQGVTAGATTTEPAPEAETAPEASTGTPSSYSTTQAAQ